MQHRTIKIACATLAAVAMAALSGCASGTTDAGKSTEAWAPTKDVTITVAFPAGGGTDAAARALAEGLENVRPDINVVVVNREGGSGTVGYTYAAQQAKDPHELTFVEPGFVVVPETTKVPFSAKDFNTVGGVSLYTSAIIAPKGKFADLDALLKAAGEKSLTVGFPNATGPQAMSVELMEDETGVEFEHIVFQNGGEITAAVASGDVDFGLTALENAAGFIDDGRIDALAVFSAERIDSDTYADVPTTQEAGLDVVFSGFRGVVTGGDVTDAQLKYWVDALDDYRASDEFAASLKKTMTQKLDESAADFRSYLDDYTKLIRPVLPNLGS